MYFPLGLGYLGATLHAGGHEVGVYNAEHGTRPEHWSGRSFSGWQRARKYSLYPQGLRDPNHEIWAEVRRTLIAFAPDLVGISSSAVDLHSAHCVAAIVKEVAPELPVVLGGPQATVDPIGVMRSPNVDYAVRGEGERTLLELVNRIAAGSNRVERIAGLAYRSDDEVRLVEPRPLTPDLDSLPVPRRDQLLGLGDLPPKLRQEALGQIQAARGCPFGCRFCGAHQVWGSRQPRWRAPEKVVDEACHLRDTYGLQQFVMWEDTFGLKKDRVEQLCAQMGRRAPRMGWVCLIRANLIDDRLLETIRAGGCTEVQLGVESASDRLLESMTKGVHLGQIRQSVRVIRRHRMRWHGFFVIGFPGETLDEMEQTLRLIEELEPDTAELSIFTPYKGTSYYEELDRQGRLPDDENWIEHDTSSLRNYFGGTMAPAAFREFAMQALESVDRYNAERRARRSGRHLEPCAAESAAVGASCS
jgi:radical SAM superfamily enzyme YgiQ (UPF0313 family)